MHNRLFQNNRDWVTKKTNEDPDFFTRHAKGQTPEYLFISCSDSRIPINEITGTGAGELFIHRNVSNLVVPTDMNLLSVLQFAIDALQVKQIVVCGHYECGGIKAAVEGKQSGMIAEWLRHVQDVYRQHEGELDAINDENERHRKLVELNVLQQVYRLNKTSIVTEARKRGQKFDIHGWVYDLHKGLLIDLEAQKRPEIAALV